ncbi:MAG: right-handed parallel beta-helix repeat-containing protein, partial [Methanomassiliicoccales archaeon]
MAMKRTEEDNGYIKGKKIFSALIVWVLVVSGFMMMLPFSFPTVKGDLVHDQSAQWEDSDASDGNPGNGLDYNGGPAGDMKVTWREVNNTHFVTDNFIVQDGYILEIEAGADVRIDSGYFIRIGDSVTGGGTIYCNGTTDNRIIITQYSSGSPWYSIEILEGSYGYMENTDVDGGGRIYALNSTLDMINCSVMDMDSFGIDATGSTVTLTNCTIANTDQPGIYVLASTLTVEDSYVANGTTSGIYCEFSSALINNSDVFGRNGSAGISGGHGIYLTGFCFQVTISNNTIIGGNGGDSTASTPGGRGGFGIFDVNLDGRVYILDNILIQGGRGGDNSQNGG